MGRPTPVDPGRLPALLADLLVAAADAAVPTRRLRVVVDGAPASDTGALADSLVPLLRERGRPAVRVSAGDFLLPASLRYEHGRRDLTAYAERRIDAGALRREVLDPLGPGGDGRWLPTLWDPRTDRATRAPYAVAPERSVLLLDGPLLLGRGLPYDLAVHVHLSPAALRRRTPEDEHWTLPAYEAHVRPATAAADVVVRADDPRHPAVVLSPRPARS